MEKVCYDKATSEKESTKGETTCYENEREPARMLWQLFKATFLLSAFTFGGGFVIVSLMKKKFVEDLQWLEEEEMLDITAIAQSSPGPIPINASVILGYRMYGVIGSLVAILGTALPPHDHHLGYLCFLHPVPLQPHYRHRSAGHAGRCSGSHLRRGHQPGQERDRHQAYPLHSPHGHRFCG